MRYSSFFFLIQKTVGHFLMKMIILIYTRFFKKAYISKEYPIWQKMKNIHLEKNTHSYKTCILRFLNHKTVGHFVMKIIIGSLLKILKWCPVLILNDDSFELNEPFGMKHGIKRSFFFSFGWPFGTFFNGYYFFRGKLKNKRT